MERILKIDLHHFYGTAEEVTGEFDKVFDTGFLVSSLTSFYKKWEKELPKPYWAQGLALPERKELAEWNKKTPIVPGCEITTRNWNIWRSGKIRLNCCNEGLENEFYTWYEIVITPTLVY